MIRGLGLDLCAIDDMAARLTDLASVFFANHFTPAEMSELRTRASRDPARHAAGRYAAKEACVKALSTAAGGHRLVDVLDYREIEIVSAAGSPPYIRLHGQLQLAVRKIGIERMMLSMTHEHNMAAAVVIIE